jgi:hypothetical protein
MRFQLFSTRDGDVVTSAPQLLFGGSYLELAIIPDRRCNSFKDLDKILTHWAMFRYTERRCQTGLHLPQPFEWTAHESAFCENLGENTLAVSGQQVKADLVLYPKRYTTVLYQR